MKNLLVASLVLSAVAASAEDIPNPLIDYAGFEKQVSIVGALRAERRLSESEFMVMSRDPDTVVLDARSAAKFELLHIKGARNLSLPDVTEEELAKVIPSKTTRVLIYCNNNFTNEPRAFASKDARASLNIYTFNVLATYGYTNVYELGPLLNINRTRLEFEGTEATKRTAAR
jgi:3-mercaptopyruvate sulfurtransferase SseA